MHRERILIDRSGERRVEQWCENSLRVPCGRSLLPERQTAPGELLRQAAIKPTLITANSPFLLRLLGILQHRPTIVLLLGENSFSAMIIYSAFFVFCCANAISRIWRVPASVAQSVCRPRTIADAHKNFTNCTGK